MPCLKGSKLHPDDRRHVLAAYVHRFTGEHIPRWASEARPDGSRYPVQFVDDGDWLEHTVFKVRRRDGRLDRRARNCMSRPTWPHNPELRTPTPSHSVNRDT